MSRAPKMSVILVVQRDFEGVRRTVRHLEAQTERAALELLLVAVAAAPLAREAGTLDGFAAVTVIEFGPIGSIAAANAAGVRAARAPLVVLAEDHSFPEPDWAARLMEAHRGPWAAVGPAVTNANPMTTVSWADFYLGYGPWADPTPPQPLDHLPGHNSSYKREVLLEYDDRLEAMLEAETLLHWDLRRRGRKLFLEGRARTAHVNFSRLSSWLAAQYHSGRVFAGTRNRRLGTPKRILYLAASPLIPLARLRHTIVAVRGAGRDRSRFVRTLPMLSLGLLVNGVGQAVGHAAGVGRSPERRARFEFNRFEHLARGDRVA